MPRQCCGASDTVPFNQNPGLVAPVVDIWTFVGKHLLCSNFHYDMLVLYVAKNHPKGSTFHFSFHPILRRISFQCTRSARYLLSSISSNIHTVTMQRYGSSGVAGHANRRIISTSKAAKSISLLLLNDHSHLAIVVGFGRGRLTEKGFCDPS